MESSVLYEVDCAGNETEILNCLFSTTGFFSEHSASVICKGLQFCIVGALLCML